MNRYALTLTASGYTVVLQVLDIEGEAPARPAAEPSSVWRNITGNDAVQPGMKMQWGPAGEEYFEITAAEQELFTSGRMQQRFDEAARWLDFNPLQYKLDLGVGTPADEAALVAFKQYFVALSEVKNNAVFPQIIWPVAPF